jgi:hypothetical protein
LGLTASIQSGPGLEKPKMIIRYVFFFLYCVRTGASFEQSVVF